MEFSADTLERVVCQFYQSDLTTQAQAHEWLKKAINSPEAWAFVWDLMQRQKPSEVQFFAATTLHNKIKKNLHEIPPDSLPALRDKLLATINTYSSGPKIVLNRLCISLAAYLIQTCPEKWPDALPSLLVAFTPRNLVCTSSKCLWVLLEILIVLPEELSRMHLLQHQKGLLLHHLHEHTPSVITVLEKILKQIRNISMYLDGETSFRHSTICSEEEVILQAMTCASSWITIGVPITQFKNLSEILVDVVFFIHKDNPGICEKALECLKAIVDQPENYKYPMYLLDFLTKILPLVQIIRREFTVWKSFDQELISNIYNLFLSFGGTHCRQCLNWIKQGGDAAEKVMLLVKYILGCSGASGCYPTDETYSRLAFGFWYILQDEIIVSSPQDRELFMKHLGPIYEDLVNVLIRKAQLPDPEKNFTEEDLEAFRCYRQDISDTLMYCHSILRESTIRLIHFKLQKINVNETKWQELEACLFSLSSISENIESDENELLPALFQYIRNLPFQRLDPKVFSTALDTIGAYADWISAHSSTLYYVLPLIIEGINVPETTSSATMALKDLARDCQYDIKPYSSLILEASQKALHGGRLKLNDSQRLMCTVGILLSVLPLDTIMYYLNLILTPYLDQLDSLAHLPPSPQVKSSIFVCLKMVGMLSSTLNTKLELNSDCVPVNSQVSQSEPQPVLIILQKMLPIIKIIANSWSSDEHVMQSLFAVLKHSVTTLHEDAHSAVTDILDLIVSTYRVHPQPAALDLSKTLCILFGRDEKYEDIMQSLTSELCSITMTTLSSAQNLSDHTDILETLFTFLGQTIKKTPKLIARADSVSLFQCATITLAIPELPTVKSAASFLVNFITQSSDNENFTNVVNVYGEKLVLQLVSCVAGEASRSNIEPLAQIFLALNKNYIENHSRWLRLTVNENICPRTTSQQRESFISSLLIGKANGRICQDCQKDNDSAEHTLKDCTAWEEERRILRDDVPNLELKDITDDILQSERKWNAFDAFCKKVLVRKLRNQG